MRWLVVLLLALACDAHAARNYTATQTPAVGTAVDMGSTVTFNYAVTNTSTGGQAGERIYEVRFRLNAGGSVFSTATAAPAGWTRTFFSTTEVAFRADSWATAIAVGATVNFGVVMTMQTSTTTVTENLRDIRGSFTDTTTGPPFNNQGTGPINNAGGWTLAALSITSFIITDTLGNPITALLAGQPFRLVMTVKNNTSVTQNPVVSNPNPPTAVKTGTVTQGLTGTTGSPLNLAPGASGTITFNYNTAATDNGTIYFTAQARRSAQVYSTVATSTTLAVGRFVASVTPSALCQYVGSNLTVTVGLMNAYPFNINNAVTTLTPVGGAPVTYLSGPVPANPVATVPPSPPVTNVVYTYQVNATGTTDPFTFNASATGTLGTAGNPPVSTPVSTSFAVRRGSFAAVINPAVVNADSTNVEMTVTVSNTGCTSVSSVSVSPPAGWVGAADTYSLVGTAAGSVENWTAAGATAVTFTSPDVASQMPVNFAGEFSVVYANTPAAIGIGVFTVRVTDANGQFQDIPLNVTVNAFKSGSLNDAATRVWREEFR